jgi:hypothetical protein
VQNQLSALGLSAAGASERVNALTDDEVQQLAGKIDSLPAGADGGRAQARRSRGRSASRLLQRRLVAPT